MPKRKRSQASSSTTILHEYLSTSRKNLQRALKEAKGFERQKLSKRLKNATAKGEEKTAKRIEREVEALKALAVEDLAMVYFKRCLGKIKAVRERLLAAGCHEWVDPGTRVAVKEEKLSERKGHDEEKLQIEKQEMEDKATIGARGSTMERETELEKRAAFHNVTSNMCHAAVVRNCVAKITAGVHLELGIPIPILNGKTRDAKKKQEPPLRSAFKHDSGKTAQPHQNSTMQQTSNEIEESPDESSWNGLESGIDDIAIEKGFEDGEDQDDEGVSHYDHLIGGSSAEESFDDHNYEIQHPSKRAKRTSVSLSPSPSLLSSRTSFSPPPRIPSSEIIPTKHAQPAPFKSPKPPKASAKPPPTSLSTFLPSLYGGYISGSSSGSAHASDDDDDDSLSHNAPIRKNRPGQAARRAIWEKKYGIKANHIQSGKGSVTIRNPARQGDSARRSGRVGPDDGWDARRGAKPAAVAMNRSARRAAHGSSSNTFQNAHRAGGFVGSGGGGRGTGENSVPVEERKREARKRDDVGVLHPSWQAAKKAKEREKGGVGVKFEGKKVVF